MSMTTIEERLCALEQKQRALRTFGGSVGAGLGVVLMACVSLGTATPAHHGSVVEAGEFRLIDAEGRARAAWRITENGPDLFLLDESGQARVELFVADWGPGLNLYDAKGRTRARVHGADAGPTIDVFDEVGGPTWSAGNAQK
jgi:hypothetical protein